MADVSIDKKLKLANTKKRFKELKELKKKRSETGDQNEECAIKSNSTSQPSNQPNNGASPVEQSLIELLQSSASITQSQENPTDLLKQDIAIESKEDTSLPNYFKSNAPAAFFDDISNSTIKAEQDQSHSSPSLLTYFNTSQEIPQNNENLNIGLPKYFDNVHSSDVIWENTVPEKKHSIQDQYTLFPEESQSPVKDEDVTCQDYPEIVQNAIQIEEFARQQLENSNPERFSIVDNSENILSPTDQTLMNYYESIGATEQEKLNICHTNQEIDSATNLTKKEIQHSNLESLKQLSSQLAEMIEPNYDHSLSRSVTNLEERNIGLAANLDQEMLESKQLHALNKELQSRITELETALSNREISSNLHNAQEVLQLKNELQTQIQTIGLLVAEKTDLTATVSQYELNLKQKIAECEELQARLRTSRGKVADLERELHNFKSDKAKFDVLLEEYDTTLEKIRGEYRSVKEQNDELTQDLLEVREKLKNTLDENVRLQEENKDLSGKLSLAEIKIQQLSFGGSLGTDNQIEQLTQQKFSLESEIANLNQMLKSIIKERDESTAQYHQYAQQLSAQIESLSTKLSQLQQEKETYINQEQERIKHIGVLEKQLQSIQSDQITYAARNSNNTDVKVELEKSRELCVELQIEKTSAQENFTKVSNENKLLVKELEAKTDSISQLESIIEQLRGNQPDSVKLLATMESDKVAASRAIQQNKELKQQLESMQEVFKKMDNDKVELTENLRGQQQTNKELIEKMQKTEATLQSLADAIEIKDQELQRLRNASEELTRQALHHEQLEDRWRHYEAHDNSAYVLQKELQEAKQTILKLKNELNQKEENNELIYQLNEARQTILQLTDELNLSRQLSNSNQKFEKSQDVLEIAQVVDDNQKEFDKNENVLDKENVMKYLEEKVKKTMQEIADLTDEKQRLEHIVMQLQGETETIGEYVALYQHQRMVLKQKALEKDQQLKQLATDREQIKIKLGKLNELIKKLVTEKGTLPMELIEQHESMMNQKGRFCEEHAKINDDISKITQNDIEQQKTAEESKEITETAEEIITLLSEIKASNLVEPDENYHCPWCSGQLMTV
ncbi:hypothetical protein ABEB36_002881 [Hypothenemus hampei]|uniref:Golgin subfamily A conserved domain-containing protein n=1 Tax=Hypothenemus hampei TaxID=57062 RepID=A0ABD1F7C7_HYPHA